jgi:type III restriction enzyme
VEMDGAERLYFVVETKSSLFTDDLRDSEGAKIRCGEEHFKALDVGKDAVRFIKATSLDDVLMR